MQSPSTFTIKIHMDGAPLKIRGSTWLQSNLNAIPTEMDVNESLKNQSPNRQESKRKRAKAARKARAKARKRR